MKRNIHRIISLVLAAAMLIPLLPSLPAHVHAAETSNILSLRYDDRYDITGKTVEIVDGEGIVAVENDTLRAVGVGNAMVRIDGKLYDVTVDKAKINIVVIMGQSNAGNHFANATSDVTCAPGTAYWWKNGATEPVDYTEPSKGFHTPLLAELYAQSAAAGDPVKNVMVWQEGVTSKNGQSIVKWAASETDTSGTDGTATMIKNCIAYYEQNSDKFEIVNCGVYWLQGESDVSMSPEKYTGLFMAMWDKLKNAGAEYLAFFRVRCGTTGNTSEHHDLGYTGSLTAQLQMINDNADMFMASTVTENWEGNETTEHSVDIRNYITLMEEYGKEGELNDSYGNAATFKNGILTTTMKTLYGSNNKCHYGKFGYGIIGADAAYNMYHALHTDEFSIVQTDTSGKAAAATISKPGDAVTIDITEMTENLAFRASCGSAAGTLAIKVESGNEDITEKVIANETNTYGTVDTEILREYDNVVITVMYNPVFGTSGSIVYSIVDNSPEPPKMYFWDFENDLNARDENGEVVNSFGETALNGSYVIENGMLKGNSLQLALGKQLKLCGDENWSIEWKFGEVTANTTGFLLCNTAKSAIGTKAVYFSIVGNVMVSDYKNSKGYYNYFTEEATFASGDCIKITNTYDSENGKSVLSLWKNGKLIVSDLQKKGYINSSTYGTYDMSTYPLSGDFVFNYLGCTGLQYFPVTGEIDYLKIIPEEENAESLSLRYDDRYDITGKTVEIVDAGTPTSFKVGYGVTEGTLDDAVITLDGSKLIATGIGTAQVKIDGILYEITVEAAPISLLLLIGQSNMRGSEGNADQSIVCPDGMVYATFGDDRGDSAGVMNVNNATNFAASALTGQYSTINVNGTTDNLSFYPINSLTDAGKGTFGPDSGFAYEWVKQTGEKVWVVNAAHGGSSITSWQPNATNYKEAVLLFSACQETLRKEIAAGHFTLSHMGYFWCQGCTDRTQTAQWYVEKYLAMHNGLKDALAFDYDSDSTTTNVDFEFAGIIPVRVGNTVACYRDGNYEISNPYSYHESFVDLRFSGPRVAQYWMINNPELPDIWGVCNIGEDWVWMPDGTNGVSAYFQAHYPGGTVDYTTQVKQSDSWYTPTTPKAVHDSVHYNQIGYNEIGRESARNALILLGEIEAPQVETTVEFLSWDGYTPVDRVYASASGNSGTLVVPKVYPIWNSKTVQYELSAGLTWNYYDLLSPTPETTGTLTAGLKTVTVIKAEPYTHFSDHLAQLPENICSELNLWSVLEHDEAYYASGTAWGVHSSGNVPSVTFFIQPGDKIFATSFGAAGTNGHATSGGIRVTFFSEYGVAKTMSPTQVYAEFTANGGYLVAPEGAVAINIPMWDNSDNNEIYILNRAHFYEAITIAPTCKTDGYTLHKCICGDSYMDSFVATTGEHTYNAVVTPPTCAESGYTTHTCLGCGSYYTDSYVAPTGQHSFSDWTATKAPTPDSLGEEQRTCSVCDLIETQEVEGVWQIYDLAAHLIDLPEHICCDTNLWALLPHENVHFTSGKRWGTTGTPTTSITIPVNPGDRIYATSWNKAGENGHATSDGIRLTFFDAYGIALTLGPGESYRQFAANGGYLVAPEGTVAINIVMWYDSEDYEVYILNREHTYAQVTVAPTCTEQGYSGSFCKACCTGTRENIVAPLGHSYSGTVCTRCGAEHPNAADYSGKVISILGDSISTFAGYIPVADGFNLTHLARYPQDNLLTDVNETWWMQTIAELDGKLGINDSWRGSTVSGYPSVTTGVAGYLAAMSNLTQIQNLGSNGTPDVILFYGGTNDLAHTPSLGTFDPATAPSEVDLTTLKWNNLADAYAQTLLRLKHFYPNTQIICLLPTYTTSYYSNEKLAQGNALMASICEHYGITYIDLRDCGISTADLPDGIHPDATGMDYITNAVLEALLAQDVESGENVVHSVTHDLTGATSSLGYYKGISDGKAFVTTIAGDDLTVTVTMGGVDITAQVYADGVITIPAVIGDLVITAEGRVKPIYEEHLQLPDPYYGVDLWKTLAHDDEYFYIDAWTVHSSGNVYSVTFPVTPGDKIVASSFGAAGSNGATMNGIRITWFDTDGVLHSAGPAEVYAEFDENGYLTVPEGAVAVNIPMWTNTNQWELYVYDSSYEPTFSLGDHLQQLPEDICAGTNLWNILKPENAYYTGSAWGNLTTDQVWSVTIAVTAGDQIWATSFQKYGSNGNNFSTNNGIRITWFGANGVLKSVTPEETYKEFSSNGYITVPDGAVTVNIPMWSGSNSNELYILNLAHVPGDPVRENEGPHGSHDRVTYCTICGEELSREHDDGYLPGDINGDGLVNNKDVTRLFQYLSDYDVEVVEEALDVNGDGSVNNKDLTRLFQYLSDYEVELH